LKQTLGSVACRRLKRAFKRVHTELHDETATEGNHGKDGTDGSKAFLKEHAHFTVNTNGVKTVDFDTTRMVCT